MNEIEVNAHQFLVKLEPTFIFESLFNLSARDKCESLKLFVPRFEKLSLIKLSILFQAKTLISTVIDTMQFQINVYWTDEYSIQILDNSHCMRLQFEC